MARYDAFKPEILAKQMMVNRERESVMKNLCYKGPLLGEITQMGDILRIAGIGRPTVETYTPGTPIALESKTAYNTDLKITEAKYVNVGVERIDKVQAAGEIFDIEVSEARKALAQTCDYFLTGMYTQAGSTVTKTVTATTVLADLSDVEKALLEADVPLDEEMFLVVTPAIYEKIRLGKIIYQNTNNDVFTKGFKGQVLNFNTYVSNNIRNNSSTTDYCMAFTRQAIAFAEQIPPSMIERYKPEASFQDAFKVLHLYGATVIKPAELVCFAATEGSES